MGIRRKAREAALQMLYQMDLSGVEAEQAIELFWDLLKDDPEGREFADELVRGYGQQQQALDARIGEASRHWRVERMSRVDLSLIRLGAYEVLHRQDVPNRVALNEAIELAKRFGHEDSAAFVNGILDRIAAEAERG